MQFASIDNPFPGLRPFEFDDRAFFFGRNEQIEELFRKLVANRFVAVVGASGSGKSSLVKAGLSGRFADISAGGTGARWEVISLRPLGRPLNQLATAFVEAREARAAMRAPRGRHDKSMAVSRAEARLTRSSEDFTGLLDELRLEAGDHLVIIVDQFEELFRYPHMDAEVDFDERALFVKHLLAAARAKDRNYHVLITMRSEFIGECTSFQGLAEAINDSQFLTPRLTRAQRREAILGPIALAHGEIAPELLQRLLNDVGHEPDQLPVMQHALMRSWQVAQPARRLELRHYESVGCMASAISNHADAVFERLSPDEQRIAEQVFKALTDVDRDGRIVRRPLRVRQLVEVAGGRAAQVLGVIEAFRAPGCAFLVPGSDTPIDDESVIDITHEALIRKWGRLNAWVQEEANNGRIYTRLREVADEFKRNPRALLGSYEAQDREAWWRDALPTPAWARRYSSGKDDVSFDDVQRLISVSIASARREHQRRMGLFGAIVITAVTAAVVSGYFWFEANKATETALAERDRAHAAEVSATAAAADAVKAKNATVAASEQLAHEKDRADQALRDVYHSRAAQATRIVDEGDAVTGALLALELLPDETSWSDLVRHRPFAIEARAALEHALTEVREEKILHGHEGSVLSVTFSPEGTRLLTASSDGTARLWDADSGKQVKVFGSGETPIESAVFSPDGKMLLTASDDGTARLWDAETGALVATFKHDGKVYSARFSADGKRVVTASADKTVRIWDIPSGPQRQPSIPFPLGGLEPPAGPDSTGLVVELGREAKKFDGNDHEMYSASFSPDGHLLAIASDAEASIWDAGTGEKLRTLGSIGVYDIEFSPVDQSVVTAGQDGAHVWDAKTGEEIFALGDAERDSVIHAHFSGDGARLVTVSNDMTARVWDARNGEQVRIFKVNGEDMSSAALAPDGLTIVTGHSDGTARIWSIDPNLFEVREFDVQADDVADAASSRDDMLLQNGYVTHVEASSDGLFLLTRSDDRRVRLWDAKTLEFKGTLDHNASSAVFSPEGKRVLTASEDGNVRIWDLATGKSQTFKIVDAGAVHTAVFDRQGTHFLTTADAAPVTIWDIETGQPVHPFPYGSPASFAIFSPDGTRVITVEGNVAQLRNVELDEVQQTYDHEEPITYAAFSSKGDKLVTASEDGTAKIWETDSGKNPVTVGDRDWGLLSAVFSPDDTEILTASEDSTASLWDATSGGLISVLSGHRDWVRHASFTPDGQSALTASDDGTVRVWPLFRSTQEAIDFAQARLPRCLTSKQQRDFNLPADPPPFCMPDKWPSTSALYHLSEGKTLLAANDDEKAQGLFDRAIAQDPSLAIGAAEAYVERAGRRLNAGRDKLATDDIGIATNLNPAGKTEYQADLANDYRDRAIDRVKNGEDQKAQNDLNEAISLNGEDRIAYVQALATAMVERGMELLGTDDAAAQASLDKATRLDPDHATEHAASFADALIDRALDRISKGADDAAKADFANAAKLNPPAAAGYLPRIAEAYVDRAADRIASGDDDRAYDDLALALEENPGGKGEYDQKIAEALVTRGGDHLNNQEPDDAEADFAAALQRDPQAESSISKTFVSRGWRLESDKEYDQALNIFDRALYYDLHNADAYLGRAVILYRLSKYPLALDYVKTSIRIDPNNWLNRHWLGWIDRELDDNVAAAEDFSQAISLEPSQVNNYIGRASTYLDLLDFEKGWDDIKKADELDYTGAAARVFKNAVTVHPGENDQIDDLIVNLAIYLGLTSEQKDEIGIPAMELELSALSYIVSNVYVELRQAWPSDGSVSRCDELAAHFADPFRAIRQGVAIGNVEADSTIEACTEAIARDPQPRFYLQRSRAYSLSADAAEKSGDDDLMNRQFGNETADLKYLSTVVFDGMVGYPMALNNLAYNYENGRGQDKDEIAAGNYSLGTFNRVMACCAASAVEALLDAETKYGRQAIVRTASGLLNWAADLGSPGAHEKLADLAAAGVLDTLGEAASVRTYVLRHLLVAERLYRQRAAMETLWPEGQSAELDLKQADILAARASDYGAQLTSEEMTAVKAEADGFVPVSLDSLPPWLATASHE